MRALVWLLIALYITCVSSTSVSSSELEEDVLVEDATTLEDNTEEFELEDKPKHAHKHWYAKRNWWLQRHWYKQWRRQMRKWQRKQQRKAKRMSRMKESNGHRYRDYLRLKRAKRTLQKQLHIRSVAAIQAKVLRASSRMDTNRRIFKGLKKQIVMKIELIQKEQDPKKKQELTTELKALVEQSKRIRKMIVKTAVREGKHFTQLIAAKKAHKMVKRILKAKRRVGLEKKVLKALNIADMKIGRIAEKNKYNAKRFQKQTARMIKRICKRMRLGKKTCKKLAMKLHGKVKHISKKIMRRYNKKQDQLKKNLEKRIEGKMVRKTVKGMAKKFEHNYQAIAKYRDVLDVTCKMDPKSCDFFRRSMGDMVPML
ncbi:hypothetical protein EIN_296530 [Entamoeba invadens IP1]|uniref:Uncharacterized protein n=2 Tax=Entamoeba invadens TaxID=33085 RepID=L7FKE9_ENTIV|nr:hypothetical protein EIN_296530 [Entamoeba invadens IP1]BAN40341.1 hypothetical protein, conserved [Entamoeba invadens]ELP86343.1 hypothetical protein EIN_296530 [Entamoeba invadens IP1]BAN40347.1 hypothetical protein, conserved [Entamoeba invadens]BAN40380.1 hypothetical protein, conserved [Entamoeba invadens]BAN40759.1 hypothetical protein, conserved [Entamoeba invadens]|eukprot:XP_004185689.1 hypothetical protein EIN_296530 [Entamoeba invadens IP1]